MSELLLIYYLVAGFLVAISLEQSATWKVRIIVGIFWGVLAPIMLFSYIFIGNDSE